MAKPKVAVSRNAPGLDESPLLKQCDVWVWEQDTVCPQDVLRKHIADAEG